MNNNLSSQPNKASKEQGNQESTNQTKEKYSFVKAAMRNMINKSGTSLFHFSLTILGVFGILLGLAITFH